MNVPKLRFPEFIDDWEPKVLSEIADVRGGKRIPKGLSPDRDNNGHPYITVSDMKNGSIALQNIKYVPIQALPIIRNYTISKKDIYISVAGTLGLIGTVPSELDGANLTENANKLTNIKCERNYLLQYLRTGKFEKLIKNTKTDNAQPKLAIYSIKSFEMSCPGIEEQQKIAEFLSAVDEKIAALEQKTEKLETYKRGTLQKIFTQKIRFFHSSGLQSAEWQTRKLSEVFTERTERNGTGNMLSVTIANGVVPFETIDRKDNSSSDKSNYKCVMVNDIAYNSMRMWQGASGLSQYDGIVSPAYTVITPRPGMVARYWAYRFKTADAINLFQRWSQGLTSDTWNLKFNALSSLTFTVPPTEEQQKIADFLSAVDEKIELTRVTLEKTKEFKKSLLQRMFV